MVRFDAVVVLGGLLGYLVSVIASTALVFLFFRLNARMFPNRNVVQRSGHDPKVKPPLPSPAEAVALGAATLSQAYLLRHAVFLIMALIQDFLIVHGRDLFAGDFPWLASFKLLGLAGLLLAAICLLSVLSIWIAGTFFNWMTGEMNEMEEIGNGNVAIAMLFAFVLFAVTAILDEGIEDVSRALIPSSKAGVVQLR
jgi:magnesium-transporting ATPase (P-type)